jgi:hypothetical protein
VSRGYPTAQAALDAAGVQLALGLRDEEVGETVELGDIDVDHADRLRDAALERLLSATPRPRQCHCDGGPLLITFRDDAVCCCRCGREPTRRPGGRR